MMKRALLVFVGHLLFLLAYSQDCPLPSDSDIVAALASLLLEGDNSITYYPNLTKPVQYVCQAQGSRINTYKSISIIGTYIPNPGRDEDTGLFQMRCVSGSWNGDTNAGLNSPADSLMNASVRTDCYRCRSGFGVDTCRGICMHNL